MKNAANNVSDTISHTQWIRGDEELASVIIEFSVWRRGRVAAATCLIVPTWSMVCSGRSRSDLGGEKLGVCFVGVLLVSVKYKA